MTSTLSTMSDLTSTTAATNSCLYGLSREDVTLSPHVTTPGEERLLAILSILTYIVCGTGLLCNAFSVLILARRRLRSTTSVFLTALSVTDAVVLVTITALCSLGSMVNWNVGVLVDAPLLPYIYPVLRPAALAAVSASIWLTVVLTLDRYLAVCHAMRAQHLFTIRRARAVIAAVVISAVLYNIPTCFEYSIAWHYNPGLNKTEALYVLTDLGANAVYRHVYHSWVLVPLLWAIPFASLLYMNVRLGLAVRESRRRSAELGYPITRGLDTTAMLVAVVVAFLVFQSPHMVATVIWTVRPTLYRRVTYLWFFYTAILFLLVNSTANFFVYTVFSRRFRQELVHVLCKCQPIASFGRKLGLSTRRRRPSAFIDTSDIEYNKKSSPPVKTNKSPPVFLVKTDIPTVVVPLKNNLKGSGHEEGKQAATVAATEPLLT